MNKPNVDFKSITDNFCFEGRFDKAEPHGNGHINDTYAAYFTNGCNNRYLLQRINHNVFKHPEQVMENIENVTSFLKNKIIEAGGNYLRETLNIVRTRDGSAFYRDDSGNYWRAYLFIEDAQTFEAVETEDQMSAAGKAFGKFQKLLSDFPAEQLHETIPFFHNTPKRYEAFLEAVGNDPYDRVKNVAPEIEFVNSRKQDTHIIQDLINSNKIPMRVTHNDTKLNNVMFDTKTGCAACVIDLDTIMPGSLLYDFGDGIRFGASSAAEDEMDLDRVYLRTDYYCAFKRGFLNKIGDSITSDEKELLPVGARLMTLECGIRFLTDYINGDVYFKTSKPDHNLYRARTQFKLVREIERKL